MFTSKVKEKLKHYVYLYLDPRTNVPFYVGKGTGNRCFAHLKDGAESGKATLDVVGPRDPDSKRRLTRGRAITLVFSDVC